MNNSLLYASAVRNFRHDELKQEDIDYAVKRFLDTPTACNRQMCRIFYVKDKKVKRELDRTIIGLPGFNLDTVNYFIITYDLSAFAYSGERQQGLFNAGLCTCNFINALHVCGIGSCCLQWSNKHSEDKKISDLLGLLDSERIAVVVGAGYVVGSRPRIHFLDHKFILIGRVVFHHTLHMQSGSPAL